MKRLEPTTKDVLEFIYGDDSNILTKIVFDLLDVIETMSDNQILTVTKFAIFLRQEGIRKSE